MNRSRATRAPRPWPRTSSAASIPTWASEDKALALLNQALPIWRSLGLRPAEANALTYIGRVHNNLGQREEALKDLNEALAIWHDVGNVAERSKMLSMKDKLRDLGQLQRSQGAERCAAAESAGGRRPRRRGQHARQPRRNLLRHGPAAAMPSITSTRPSPSGARSGEHGGEATDPEQHGPGLRRPGTRNSTRLTSITRRWRYRAPSATGRTKRSP